jgi:hypothetical protein
VRYSELLLSLTCSVFVVACSEEVPSQTSTSLPLPPDNVATLPDAMPASGAQPHLRQTPVLQTPLLQTAVQQAQDSSLTMSQAELDKLYLDARQQIREAAAPHDKY